MNLILNPDVVALSPASLVESLMELISRLGNDKIYCSDSDLYAIRSAFAKARGPTFNVSCYLVMHFQPRKLPTPFAPLIIVSPLYARGLNPTGLICSSQESSVAVGAKGTAYGSQVDFELSFAVAQSVGVKNALMVSEVAHLSNCDYLRWRFVKHFNDYWSTPESAGIKIVDQHEHCSHGHESPCPDAVWKSEAWVSRTKGNGNSARFRPGVRFGGEKYMRLVAHILRAAYADMRYTQKLQDKFIVNVGVYVGAANGNPTRNVEIYITPQNHIHIRPSEHNENVRSAFDFPLDR